VVDESFLDLLSKCQSHRLDDQRTDFPSPMMSSDRSSQASSDDDDLFETLWRLQGSRIDEQRCPLPPASKVSSPSNRHRWQEPAEGDAPLSSDELFELIFASQVSVPMCIVRRGSRLCETVDVVWRVVVTLAAVVAAGKPD